MPRILLLTIFIFSEFTGYGQSLNVNVGVYNNPPLISINQNNEIDGFTIDILKDVAQKEGWQLNFKVYEFAEGLEALEQGNIDLMAGLAYSARRDSTYLLTKTSILTNWAKIYKAENDDLSYNSLEDLRDKSIAAVRGDYYLKNGDDGLQDVLSELTIPAVIIDFTSYNDVIEAVEQGKADLALVSRYYGSLYTEDNEVVKTPINIAYVSIRYAFYRSEKNIELAQLLDKNLLQLMNDRNSIYYASEKKYLTHQAQAFIPPWLWQIFFLVVGATLVLGIFLILLQYQVQRKTKELNLTNRMLTKSEQQARLAVQTIEASQDIGFWFEPGEPFIRVNQAAVRLTGYSEGELLQMKPRDLLGTQANEKYYDSLQTTEWDGHVLIEETFKIKNGESFPVELSLDQFELDGKTFICGFARDITERVLAERQLVERNKDLNCLYSISQLIADRSNSIEDIFKSVVNEIPLAWRHPDITSAKILYDGKYYTNNQKKDSIQPLTVDLITGKKKVGEIIVGYTAAATTEHKGPYSKEEVNLLDAVGKELSNMLDARDAERRIIASILSTEDKERSRISKELHDSVGQTLSAISLQMDSLLNKAEASTEKKKLAQIEKLLADAIAESRSVSHNLMPPALTDLGYTYAIENLLSSIDQVGETKFSFQSNESEIRVAKELEYTAFRITQEAVNNIIKYAEAKNATIQYLVFNDLISLSIEDDGLGFDLEKADKKHNFGLNSMRNRARSVGGELSIDSTPGRGTGIHVSFPIK